MMHQQISKKIVFYLFLFILLGTVNNFKFSKLYKFKINEIKVYGLNNVQNSKISNQLDFLKFDNLLFLDKIVIDEIINSNNFVEKYFVFKRYPQTLEIKILKAKNIANVVKDNNFFFIVSNGKLIKSKQCRKLYKTIILVKIKEYLISFLKSFNRKIALKNTKKIQIG